MFRKRFYVAQDGSRKVQTRASMERRLDISWKISENLRLSQNTNTKLNFSWNDPYVFRSRHLLRPGEPATNYHLYTNRKTAKYLQC